MFTQEVADRICEEIADGRSLRSICRTEGMPTKATVFRWLAENQAFRDQYARAREAQADSLFDDIVEVADDDTIEPNARRVMVDARKWAASKLKPKTYGDKLDLGGNLGLTVNWPVNPPNIER